MSEQQPEVEPPTPTGRAWSWLWEHRRSIAPFVGVTLAILCPHLGNAAGPCSILGELVRSWSMVP